MVFPSFSLANPKASKYGTESRYGAGHSVVESRYQPYSQQSRAGMGQSAPRDLISKIDRQQVVENELHSDGKLKTITTPQSVKAPSFDLRPGPFPGKTLPQQSSVERKEFGTQTTDRLFARPPDSFAREQLADKRRVEFAAPSASMRERHAEAPGQPEGSKSHIKQFTKNVQDLYKRKPKAGNPFLLLVYGEDEFKIMKKAYQMQ